MGNVSGFGHGNERLAAALQYAASQPKPSLLDYRKQKPYGPRERARQREWKRAKMASDPAARLTNTLRSRLSFAIKSPAQRARKKTEAMVGCSSAHLRSHIESLWRPGMTWENYGPAWCIDHIRPCSSFDMLDPEQQRACFHYTNLQPLWTLENQRKADKQCSPAWW